mgnify:CR=1 FL=1
MTTSSFDLLCQELADFQASRAPRRDTVTRATAPRPMAKASPVAPVAPVNFDRLAKAQDAIAADMAKSQALHTQNLIRERLAAIGADYRAGRLTAHQAAVYDVLKNRAGAMGLRP